MYPPKEFFEKYLNFNIEEGIISPITENQKNCRINPEGYLAITVNGKSYLAHRLIWLISTGDRIFGNIDHIDGNRSNNSISNLRIANHSQNAMNRKADSRNKTGIKGVNWCKRELKWKAEIRKGKKRIFRKYFDSIEEARKEIMSAREILHGEFCRH